LPARQRSCFTARMIGRTVARVSGRYVAVIGPNEASDQEITQAEAVGRLVAEGGAVPSAVGSEV
jgi:hypothetical protein